jgi:hypothetical protein
MSNALDNLQLGFEARLEEFGELITVTSGAAVQATFTAIVMPFPAVDPNMPLGFDWRELSTIQCLRDDFPDGIEAEDTVKQGGTDPSSPILYTWRVVRKDDNPADFAVKLWVVKVVENVDT